MDEIPEDQGQGRYNKLDYAYLIKCAENNVIDEWNTLYLEYLESEWNRLYPERAWDPENILELVRQRQFRRLCFTGEDFREAISRDVSFDEAHLEGAWFRETHLERGQFQNTHLEGAWFWDVNLEMAEFIWAHLEGAEFREAHLEMANFWEAHLNGADFSGAQLMGGIFNLAHLEGAEFTSAHLKQTKFWRAHLERADFDGAYLEEGEFIYAIVDGETLFTNNSIDDKTNFTGTGLSATRIDPNLRTRLERNIREMQWRKWYNKPKYYPYPEMIPKILWGMWCMSRHLFKDPPKKRYDPKDYPSLENSTFYITLRKVLSWPIKPSVTTKNTSNQDVKEIRDRMKKRQMERCWIDCFINSFVRLFWWLSDYGSSTKRVIGVFFGWNILWALIYQIVLPLLPGPILENASTTVLHTSNIITAILQTNLMMFSITDLATEGLDYPALFCVTVHIVIGYFILAALITRLGIMFQNLSP